MSIEIIASPWGIIPEKLLEVHTAYKIHMSGGKGNSEGFKSKPSMQFSSEQESRERRYTVLNGIAIIPIEGIITKRLSFFSCFFGGTSTELTGEAIKEAMEDAEVDSILLYIDSPGGTVDGTFELAELIYSLRGEKPINAYTDGLMASAAYCIGSAADNIYISGDTTAVGSIGVITTHMDASKFYEDFGLKLTDIYAGKYKAVGSQHKPLSEGDHATIQSRIDYLYGIFINTVAKHRGTDAATVLSDMADGRIFIGKQAIKAGLVDGVSTMDALIASLSADSNSAYTREEGTIKTKEGKVMSKEEQDKGIPVASITAEYLSLNRPDIFESIKTQGKTEGISEGAKTERERIQGVHSLLKPGREKIIGELMFDGETTKAEAAEKILEADDAKLAAKGTELKKEGEDLAEDLTSTEPPPDKVETNPEAKKKELIQEYQKENPKASYKETVLAVSKANPELFKG